MKKALVAVIALLLVLGSSPLSAGEIRGSVTLKNKKALKRAKNRNPNRKKTVKKYQGRAIRKALSGGKGGLPKNATVDERDYAVVFLSSQKDGAKLKSGKGLIKVRQSKRRFFNHVTAVPLGSTVSFVNEDNFFHHIYCPDSSKLNVPEHNNKVGITRKPPKLGKYELFCDIHPLMNAYVYVVPNDQFTTAKGGKFQLKGVPAGSYVLKVWHPRLKGGEYPVTVSESGATELNIKL